ncbi:MAG: hypothetical protein ABWY64_09145 [Tardiphaga sp.]
MIVTRELLEAAVALRGSQPDLWEKFLLGMRAYSAAATAEMMRCDPALLMRAQGMALSAHDIVQLLATAPEQLEKLREKARGKETSGY